MADAPTLIIATGAITVANNVILNKQPMNWKIPIATGIGALMFAGLQSASREPAVMLGWLVLVGSFIVPPKTGKSFADNLATWAGGK